MTDRAPTHEARKRLHPRFQNALHPVSRATFHRNREWKWRTPCSLRRSLKKTPAYNTTEKRLWACHVRVCVCVCVCVRENSDSSATSGDYFKVNLLRFSTTHFILNSFIPRWTRRRVGENSRLAIKTAAFFFFFFFSYFSKEEKKRREGGKRERRYVHGTCSDIG